MRIRREGGSDTFDGTRLPQFVRSQSRPTEPLGHSSTTMNLARSCPSNGSSSLLEDDTAAVLSHDASAFVERAQRDPSSFIRRRRRNRPRASTRVDATDDLDRRPVAR